MKVFYIKTLLECLIGYWVNWLSAAKPAGELSKSFVNDQRQFELVFERMIDGFAYHKMVLDEKDNPVDYIFLEVNPAFEKLTGLKKNEILGRRATQVISGLKDDPADWIGVYGRVALTGEPVQFENYAASLGKWFSVSAYSPQKGYFVTLFEDITSRKKTEEALWRAKQDWERTFDSVPDLIAILDKNHKIVRANKALAERLGKDPEKCVGLSCHECVHGTSVPPDFCPHSKTLLDGKEHVAEVYEPNMGGFFSVSTTPIRDDRGELIGSVHVARDISERKKSEDVIRKINEELEDRVKKRTEEVSKERQRLYNVLDALPAYVVLLDKDYRVLFANRVFRERFGESHGRRCHEFLFNLDSPCENCETFKVLKTNKPYRWEWRGPDGRDYDIYDFPFVEADGSTLILEMGIDITERKCLEQKVKDSERLVTIGQTAGMVGHDIRNPLQAITSDVYLAKINLESMSGGEEKKEIMESLLDIERNVEYVNKIVLDLQDFTRHLTPEIKVVNIEEVCEKILFNSGVPENIEVSLQVSKQVREMNSDPAMLKRVLTNLVNNAIQAMPNGGKLDVRAYRKDRECVIEVEDSGEGIPEDVKPKLFTPLFTTKSKGQGFGLVAAKRVIEALGGKISFESELGKGTKFIIRFTEK